MNKLLVASAVWLLSFTAVANASVMETMSVPFTAPSFGSTNSYYDQVRITVSGTGFSNGSILNDAFYNFNGANASLGHDAFFYQLNFGISPLVAFNGSNFATINAQNADNSIVGGLPAYSALHTYTFFLNVGTMTPSTLYFGVSDGGFGDNGGAYRITIEQVPEPGALALVGLGLLALFGMGVGRRGRRRPVFAVHDGGTPTSI
jgi:hypothetical protein